MFRCLADSDARVLKIKSIYIQAIDLYIQIIVYTTVYGIIFAIQIK